MQISQLFRFACFINISSFRNVNSIITKHFYNSYRYLSKKNLWIMFIVFKKNSSNKEFLLFYLKVTHHHLYLIFIYILSESSEFLLHNFLYFFSLLLLGGTSVKYLFLLNSLKYPLTLLKIRYKKFRLLIFTYYKYLIVIYPM